MFGFELRRHMVCYVVLLVGLNIAEMPDFEKKISKQYFGSSSTLISLKKNVLFNFTLHCTVV